MFLVVRPTLRSRVGKFLPCTRGMIKFPISKHSALKGDTDGHLCFADLDDLHYWFQNGIMWACLGYGLVSVVGSP